MSAAEKLRELEQHTPGNHWDAEVSAALRKALPQIVAVVEAAERAMGAYPELDLSPALAALDESLTTKGEQ